MAQPVSGSLDYDLAACIRKIVNGIKCNSCGPLAQPGGQSSQAGLRHLSCSYLACIKCVDNQCSDCSATITCLEIHVLDFLKKLRKFIEQCDNENQEGSDDIAQVVQEQVQNSVKSSTGAETPPCDSSNNDRITDPKFKKPPRPKRTSASKMPSKATSRTNLKSPAPPPPSVSAVSSASALPVSSRQRKPKVHELVTCHSGKENSAIEVSEADSSSSIVSTKRLKKKIKLSETEEEVPKSVPSCPRDSSRNSSHNGRKIGILGSDWSMKQDLLLTKFKKTFPNVKIYDDYNDEVTHVIGGASKGTRLTVGSFTYMQGLLGNKWIMSIDWIESSIKEKKVLSEEAFEMKGTKWQKSTYDSVPTRARLAMVNPAGKLFNGITFYFDGNFHYPGFDETTMKQLIELGGGKVVNVKPDQNSGDRVLVIVDDEKKLDMVTVYKKITLRILYSFINNYAIDESLFH